MAHKRQQEQEPLPGTRRPTITLPPRPTAETLFDSGLSPGPLTLVSSFFAENGGLESDSRSLSQLLAGAMSSPSYSLPSPIFLESFSDGLFKGDEFCRVSGDSGDGGKFSFLSEGVMDSPIAGVNNEPNSMEGYFSAENQGDGTLEEEGSGNDDGFGGGYKDSRPMSLAVIRSPLFTVPPGLSPSGLLSPGFFSPLSPFGMSHQQALAHVTAQAAQAQSQTSFLIAADSEIIAPSNEPSQQHPSLSSNDPSPHREQPESFERMATCFVTSAYSQPHKQQPLPLAGDNPAEDGYNWRKYGQKQVKGCEFPRSYYKCSHQRCPVRKKVERSLDGRMTEIIYKGQHNHPMPQPNKRGKDGGNVSGNANSQVKPETSPHGGNPPDWTESVKETSMQSDSVDPDEAETGVEEVDGDDYEHIAKKRNIIVEPSEVASGHNTVTESKIIVQTKSEVDLLDDGYRWRKYGQKVVKGNPHPRSYYKCTYAGCNVRKHVERAAADPKSVITTYEGKHNHDIPASRNSGRNLATASLSQVKPHKVVAEKHPLLKGRILHVTNCQQFYS